MYLKIDKRGFKKTILVFSSINTIAGRFRFDRALNDVEANIIYLNCPNNSWYLQGIPDLGSSLDESRIELEKILQKEFSDNQLYAFGSSMGAAGLLAMLPDIKLTNAFAFCPEIDLFLPKSFSHRYYNGPKIRKENLWKELGKIENVKIFYGEECPQDLMQLYNIKKYSSTIPITTFANEGHGVIEAIYFTEGIMGVINALLNGIELKPEVIERGHIYGSSIACWLIAQSNIVKGNDVEKLKFELTRIISSTDYNRSYYSQLLYAKASLVSEIEEKKELLREALWFAEDSLKIAKAYFELLDDHYAAALFKKSWINKFGSHYANQKRAMSVLSSF